MFSWIPFCEELAKKLLDYRDRQEELVDFIEGLKEQGQKVIQLEPGFKKLDPFTFFSNFNRGLTDDNRKAILSSIKDHFKINSAVPDDFYGIPVATLMNARFYKKSDEASIDTLWQLAEQAINSDIAAVSESTFNECLQISGIRIGMLSMGLFWIQPKKYMPLDGRSKEYLIARGIELPKEIHYQDYSNILPKIIKDLSVDFEKLSHSAYIYSSKIKNQLKEWKQAHLAPQRSEVRIKYEQLARDMIQEKLGRFSEQDIKQFLKYINTDYWNNTETDSRFGMTIQGHNRNLISSNPSLFNEYSSKLWNATPESIEAVLDDALKNNIKGAGTGLPTMILYLKDNQHYTIWLEAMHKGLLKAVPSYKLSDTPSYKNYHDYNEIAMTFKNEYQIEYQYLDLLLSALSKNGPEPSENPEGSKQEPEQEPTTNNPPPDFRLNTILYGPPGTGKTYWAMRRAIEICDGTLPETQEEISARYKKLQQDNRIKFVTFHQSYGYEEFVEGIRPVLTNDGQDETSESVTQVSYMLNDGIFKRMCELAKGSHLTVKSQYNFDEQNTTIWKMSLGNTYTDTGTTIFKKCMDEGLALLGWGDDIDFSDCTKRAEIAKLYKEHYPETVQQNPGSSNTVFRFVHEMQKGDLIIVTDGNRKFRAIGKITGDYHFIQDYDYSQARDVEWLVMFEESQPHERLYQKWFSQNTLYQLSKEHLKMDELKRLLSTSEIKPPQNHVLIIDEINRGNISKILGELITLLEPDKRLGGANELTTTLPYSGESFGVPKNLYLIGTMNTADRSIAFMDTALRRRFRFEEMMPASKVIKKYVGENGIVDGVDIAALMETINNRIEILYDRDHQIGHSYFLGIDSLDALRETFRDNIIPLLQEYFYDDWGKICQVLGCSHEDSDGGSNHKYPIILRNKVNGNMETSDYYDDDKYRYTINPTFKEASKSELNPFFKYICKN
jgi:AAA domain (dynein-related subfamily)